MWLYSAKLLKKLNMKKLIYFLNFLTLSVFAQQWQPLDNGLDGTVRALLPDTTHGHLIIGGDFARIHGNIHKSLAAWNGTRIDSIGTFSCMPTFSLGAMSSAQYSGYVFASDCNHIYMRYNSVWLPLDSNFSGTPLCFVKHDSTLYIGGGFNYVNDTYGGSLAYLRAGHFRNISLPYANSMVNDIAFLHDTMYVLMSYPDSIGKPIPKVLQRNCSCQGWVDITPYLAYGVSWAGSLETYKGALYLAGKFSTQSGSIGDAIICYDGTWHDVSGGITQSGTYGQVYTLYTYGNLLFVGGFFQYAGGVPASNIATWNGSYWCGFNGVLNDAVRSVAGMNDSLYIGGQFTSIDGIQTNYIARYQTLISNLCH